jgi:hypothetical protein
LQIYIFSRRYFFIAINKTWRSRRFGKRKSLLLAETPFDPAVSGTKFDARTAEEMIRIIPDQEDVLFSFETIYKSALDTSNHGFL